MKLSDLGEFGLIDRIERAVQRKRGRGSRAVVVGIGDDAAVLRPKSGDDVVVSTDAFVENVHFRWKTQDARMVGRRAAAAALSDLAAMGARPLGMVVALAAPPALDVRKVDGVVRGLLDVAGRHGSPLVGGNVTRARETSLAVTAVGAVVRGRQLLRSAARRGDRLCVTGTLGEAALELARAERGGARVRRVPEPRIEAGRRLARSGFAGACIDLSDGLVADLQHVLRASRVGAVVDAERLPEPRDFARRCSRAGIDPSRAVLAGGEDFELLFTVRPNAPSEAVLARRLGVRVSEIGSITRRGLSLRSPNLRGARSGWRHF